MKQIIHGATDGNSSSSARYTSLHGFSDGGWSSSTYLKSGVLWTAAGTLRNFKVTLSAAYGSSIGATFTIQVNGVDTGLTVTITDPATTATDSTNSYHIVAGDVVGIKRTTTATVSNTVTAFFYTEFDSDSTGESSYGISAASNVLPTTPEYQGLLYPSQVTWFTSGDLEGNESAMPINGTITRWDVSARTTTDTPLTGVQTVNVAIYKNGVKQDGTGGTVDTRVTLNSSSDRVTWTGSLPVVVGDRLAVEAYASTSITVHIGWGVLVQASVNGQFILMIEGSLPSSGVRYASGFSEEFWNATEANVQGIGGPTTFYINSLTAAGLAGGSRNHAFVGRLNGATPATTVSGVVNNHQGALSLGLAGATTPSGSAYLTITDSDRWAIMATTAASIRGSAVFGTKTTVTATRAVAFGLDDATNVHSETGKLRVFGNVGMTGYLELADGMTAPAALAGRARIYVDTADGDLKIVFGDGTVKTITIDT